MISSPQTESLIKETAKKVLFQKGLLYATTQEIADEAGVNRALIHYYFRSREHLIATLFEEAIAERKARFLNILGMDAPLQTKIATFIDVFIDRATQNPHIDNFIIGEMIRRPNEVKFFCIKDSKLKERLQLQLDEEISKGTIKPISLTHFLVNLSSLCNYPILAKPILQTIHGMSELGYKKFLQERKKVIFKTIFKNNFQNGTSDPAIH